MERIERILRTESLQQIGGKLLRTALIIFFTYLVSRVPLSVGSSLSAGCFSAAIGMFAYMLSRSSVNLYLLVPAAAGMMSCFSRGYDVWGELAALCICGLVFVSGKRLGMAPWHQSVIAASVTIVSVSIYRMASATVYQLTVKGLLEEAVLVFCFFHLFEAFFRVWDDSTSGGTAGLFAKQLALVSFPVVGLLVISGLGLTFFIWPCVIFLALVGLAALDLGQAVLMASAAGCFAALEGQPQWGFLLTILLALCLGSMGKRLNTAMGVAAFTAACAALGQIESGLILGIDVQYLILAIAVFTAVYWKFGTSIHRSLQGFTSEAAADRPQTPEQIKLLLQDRAKEMEKLAELYGTYVDRRAALANQFQMTQQMLDTLQREMIRPQHHAKSAVGEKLEPCIAASQYAASGTINGDCCGWQEIGDGKMALILSDGMGKGKKAASESLMVSRTILTLLRCGVTTELALKMMNTIMMIKEDEDSFATVDLAILDCRSGKARFYKIGAAPTLLRRREHVEELRLSAVPLGIVNGLRIDFVEVTLKRGDWVIMMSDGVSDGGSGRGFLREISETAVSIRSDDPQIMCDLILDQAADSYIGKERDDLSVLVAHV